MWGLRNVRAASLARTSFVILLAGLFAVLFATVGPGLLEQVYSQVTGQRNEYYRTLLSRIALGLAGALVGAGAAGLLVRAFGAFFGRWEKMDVGDKVTLFLGIFAGLVASLPFLFLFNSVLPSPYIPLALLGLMIGFAALSVYALQSMGDILPWMRGKGRSKRRGIKILDTNVIIDGRVYDVARTGFLEGQIYVPGFVLDELQHIADSHDALRRQRGRRGLDVLRHMQADFPLEVRIHDRFAPDPDEQVDSRLVRLAKALGADIVTNDFNLNRVAALQDVRVLNLNDLALAMRPNVLPKETLCLTVIREGNQPGQGVGYLDDGTMVVIEHGKHHIGETVEVVVTQVIQTERGKMIFGEIDKGIDEGDDENGMRRKLPRRPQ
jgi:uncharacterized protein YacL